MGTGARQTQRVQRTSLHKKAGRGHGCLKPRNNVNMLKREYWTTDVVQGRCRREHGRNVQTSGGGEEELSSTLVCAAVPLVKVASDENEIPRVGARWSGMLDKR